MKLELYTWFYLSNYSRRLFNVNISHSNKSKHTTLESKKSFFNSFLEPFQAEVSDRTGRVTNIPVTIGKFTLLVGKNIVRWLNIVQTICLQQVNRILRKPFWTKRTTENLSCFVCNTEQTNANKCQKQIYCAFSFNHTLFSS